MNPHPNPQPSATTEPGQLIAPGHRAGDLLEAYNWLIVTEAPGKLRVRAHLPERLKNPQGQLFGGFTPTYVDLVSLFTVHAGETDADPATPRNWLTTINMRCDYFEPIVNDTFEILGEIVNRRGLTISVSTKFFQGETMAAHALTTIREVPDVS